MAVAKPKPKAKTPIKVKVPVLSPVRPPRVDLDVANLILKGPKQAGKQLSTVITRAITTGQIENTIEGASTLTLSVTDWAGALMRSQMLKGEVQLEFDGETFVLTKVARQSTVMTLTFEDRAVNLLRSYTKAKKADRASTTRAQFIRSMVQEVKEAVIPFQCPELNVKEPIGKPKALRARTQREWLH
jgi:hypothetical protein